MQRLHIRLTNQACFIANWARLSDSARETLTVIFTYAEYDMRLGTRFVSVLRHGVLPGGVYFAKRKAVRAVFDVMEEDRRDSATLRKIKPLTDRDYQIEALDRMERNAASGGILLVATGAGKTYIAAEFMRRCKRNVLFIVDELTLLAQARADIASVTGEEPGQYQAATGKFKRLMVATVQTLEKRIGRDPRLNAWLDSCETVFIDELHTMLNPRMLRVARQLRARSACAFYGLTATLQTKDAKTRLLAGILTGKVLFRYGIDQAARDGQLAPCVVLRVQCATERVWQYDYNSAYGAHIAFNERRNAIVEKLVLEAHKQGLFSMLIVDRVQHVKNMADTFKAAGLRVKAVHGAVSAHDRRLAQEAVDAGKLDVLVANKVFAKGISIKRVSAIIDATGKKSRDNAIQRVGRGTRKHAEKLGAIYFDIADTSWSSPNFFTKAAQSRLSAYATHKLSVTDHVWRDETPKRSAREAVAAGMRALQRFLKRNTLD